MRKNSKPPNLSSCDFSPVTTKHILQRWQWHKRQHQLQQLSKSKVRIVNSNFNEQQKINYVSPIKMLLGVLSDQEIINNNEIQQNPNPNPQNQMIATKFQQEKLIKQQHLNDQNQNQDKNSRLRYNKDTRLSYENMQKNNMVISYKDTRFSQSNIEKKNMAINKDTRLSYANIEKTNMAIQKKMNKDNIIKQQEPAFMRILGDFFRKKQKKKIQEKINCIQQKKPSPFIPFKNNQRKRKQN